MVLINRPSFRIGN